MCLIAFAWNAHPRWRLLLLGNRDERHARPTAPLHRWPGEPPMLAGQDLEAGGTWMGLGEGGRAAVVTNVRDPGAPTDRASRGLLVSDYLRGHAEAESHAEHLYQHAGDYRPFNLLLFDDRHAAYIGNHPEPHLQQVTPGVHGLSNADFNTPWPKTQRLSARLQDWLEHDHDHGHGHGHADFAPLWSALADDGQWPDDVLPDTGIGIELERQLSAAFIRGEHYGTRASTMISVDRHNHAGISERRFGPLGQPQGVSRLYSEVG